MQKKIFILILPLLFSWNAMASSGSKSINMLDGENTSDPLTSGNSGGGGGSYSTPMGGNCRKSCPGGSGVTVDISDRCMCVQGKCFRIDIGHKGPLMTTNGTGTIGEANGVRFSTKPGPGTTNLDYDGLAMGINANDRYGKWIHKASGCGPGGRQNTNGCIAVPCAYWPLVKAQMGQQVTVCNANPFPSTQGVTIKPNGSRQRFNAVETGGSR